MGSRGLQVTTLVVAAVAAVFAFIAMQRAQDALDAADRAAAAASSAGDAASSDVLRLMEDLIAAGVLPDPASTNLAGLSADELARTWCEDWHDGVSDVLTVDPGRWETLPTQASSQADDGATEQPMDARAYARQLAVSANGFADRWSTAATLPVSELLDAIERGETAHRELANDTRSVSVIELVETHLGPLADDPAVRATVTWSDDNCA